MCGSDHISHLEHLPLLWSSSESTTDSQWPTVGQSWTDWFQHEPIRHQHPHTHTHTYQLTHWHACQQLTHSSMHTLAKFVILFSCPSQFHTSFPPWSSYPCGWVFVGWRACGVLGRPSHSPNREANNHHVGSLGLQYDFIWLLGGPLRKQTWRLSDAHNKANNKSRLCLTVGGTESGRKISRLGT